MTTNNQVDVGLKGSTGTGSFAGSTSAVFTTPVLGVSSATSITFGGSTLSTYVEGSWTPTDASGAGLSFSTALGSYIQFGNLVIANAIIVYPSTASGAAATIGSLPVTCGSTNEKRGGQVVYSTSAAGRLKILPGVSSTQAQIYNPSGSNTANSSLSLCSLNISLVYFT